MRIRCVQTLSEMSIYFLKRLIDEVLIKKKTSAINNPHGGVKMNFNNFKYIMCAHALYVHANRLIMKRMC